MIIWNLINIILPSVAWCHFCMNAYSSPHVERLVSLSKYIFLCHENCPSPGKLDRTWQRQKLSVGFVATNIWQNPFHLRNKWNWLGLAVGCSHYKIFTQQESTTVHFLIVSVFCLQQHHVRPAMWHRLVASNNFSCMDCVTFFGYEMS